MTVVRLANHGAAPMGSLVFLILHLLVHQGSSSSSTKIHTINGKIGELAVLPCMDGETHPNPRDMRIYWQINAHIVVHMYNKGEDEVHHQDEKYKGRTMLFVDQLEKGNYSLQITNITLADRAEYTCLCNEHLELSKVKLQPVASFIDPVISVDEPRVNNQASRNASCKSHSGYPKPNLYWTVRNGSTVEHPEATGTVITQDPDTQLYNIISYITLNYTNGSISCTVENPQLGENQTSSEWSLLPADPQPGSFIKVLVASLFGAVVLLTILGLVVKCKCLPKKGGQRDIPAELLLDHMTCPQENGTGGHPQTQETVVMLKNDMET
ncbi:T-lymphocyte activation antigen CD80-like [Polypterus senegalus]|uniref:T-lymphocyte activation antigen CD80-like n=1 Tax=Polypterus senegalus TaxID=55291 RepID=UPI0019635C9E|nr:T-lymphocyte activation antigen CD80-like [Polypterus senegalus]